MCPVASARDLGAMDHDRTLAWRRLAVRPLVLLVLAVLVVNAAGWAVDLSPLRQEEDSWGYVFAAFFLSMYAVPVLLVAAVCALLARALDDPGELAVCAWLAAVASGLAGIVLGVLAVPASLASPAGAAFGLLSVGVAVVLLSPLAACLRRTRSGEGG